MKHDAHVIRFKFTIEHAYECQHAGLSYNKYIGWCSQFNYNEDGRDILFPTINVNHYYALMNT